MQKTVYQNIAYPLEISKVSKEKIDERVNELLKFIDLEEKKMHIRLSYQVVKSKELQ